MTVEKYVDTNDTFFVSFGGDVPCSRVQDKKAKKRRNLSQQSADQQQYTHEFAAAKVCGSNYVTGPFSSAQCEAVLEIQSHV